jgi:GNAT superfamily N-acetyltransferase
VGLVGHYAAQTAAAGAALLELAATALAAQGCTLAIGPLDGNTWQRYRLVTWRGNEPPFFLEPDTPDDWPRHFSLGGFSPFAHYTSAINDDLGSLDWRGERAQARLHTRGITLRPLDAAELATPECFAAMLARIYHVVLPAFRDALLFSPISLADFTAQYAPVRPSLQPELIWLAEHGEQVIGFVFALPDLLQARRGEPVERMIYKTIAVHPAYERLGIGGLLTQSCHAAARDLGYRRAVHALMHEQSRARQISAHSGRLMRRYTLFARRLAAA